MIQKFNCEEGRNLDGNCTFLGRWRVIWFVSLRVGFTVLLLKYVIVVVIEWTLKTFSR